MSEIVNAKFAEFVTSGAFTLTLTRAQVAQLSLLASGAEVYGGDALLRKGLAVELPNPSSFTKDRTELRATPAGLIVATLLQQAGLTNGPSDPCADEIARIQAELAEARVTLVKAQEASWSLHAREQAASQDNEKLRVENDALKAGILLDHEQNCARLNIRMKDKHPGIGSEQLVQEIRDARIP